MHETRQLSVHDIVASVYLGLGLAMVAAVLASCVAPHVDYAQVPRVQLTRDVGGCVASLPLVARAEFTDDLSTVLDAAHPWSDAAGRTVVVPALEGELPNLTISVLPCPDALREGASCAHLAETTGRCEAGAWRVEIQVFVVDTGLEFTLMHELGHALGVDLGCDKFGHSCAPWSIMFHQLDGRNALMSFPDDEAGPDAPLPGIYQWVRPADAAALRRAWSL